MYSKYDKITSVAMSYFVVNMQILFAEFVYYGIIEIYNTICMKQEWQNDGKI
jgi:hypothetical protein